MHQDTVVRFRKKDEVVDALTQLLRARARDLLQAAVGEELQMFLEQQAERRDARSRLAVVVYVPKVRDRLGGVRLIELTPPEGGNCAISFI